MPIDVERLQAISRTLSDVVAAPTLWPNVLEEISKACGSHGAMLLPATGANGVMADPGAGQAALEAYIKEGWHEADRDPRKKAIPIVKRCEVAIDADVIARDEIGRSGFFNELLPRFDFKWWAGIGFRGEGDDIWCLALQRSPGQGEFEQTDKPILQNLTARLSEIAKLSYLTGRVALSEVADSFDRIQQAVVAVDETGWVIRANASAERLFDDGLRIAKGYLLIGDRKAAKEYSNLLDHLRWTDDGKSLRTAPIVLKRENATPLLIEALPVDGAARSPFLHARALLLLRPIAKPKRPDWHLLVDTFDFTPAEARLAARLVTGDLLEQVADELRITKETARTELKSVFRKTDVHRQAELVALLSSFLRVK